MFLKVESDWFARNQIVCNKYLEIAQSNYSEFKYLVNNFNESIIISMTIYILKLELNRSWRSSIVREESFEYEKSYFYEFGYLV